MGGGQRQNTEACSLALISIKVEGEEGEPGTEQSVGRQSRTQPAGQMARDDQEAELPRQHRQVALRDPRKPRGSSIRGLYGSYIT